MNEMIKGLDGVVKSMDEFLVGDSDEKEHDKQLWKFLIVMSAMESHWIQKSAHFIKIKPGFSDTLFHQVELNHLRKSWGNTTIRHTNKYYGTFHEDSQIQL